MAVKWIDDLPKAHYIATCCAELIVFWNEWWSLFRCYFGVFHVAKFHCLRVWLMMQIALSNKDTSPKAFIEFLRANWNMWHVSQKEYKAETHEKLKEVNEKKNFYFFFFFYKWSEKRCVCVWERERERERERESFYFFLVMQILREHSVVLFCKHYGNATLIITFSFLWTFWNKE